MVVGSRKLPSQVHVTQFVLSDGHEIRGVELLNIAAFSCVKIKTDGIAQPSKALKQALEFASRLDTIAPRCSK